MRGFPALVRRLGGQPEAFLRKHHIPAEVLGNDEALVSLRSLINLCEDCAQTLNAPDFGLQAAQMQDIGILGSVALAIQHAPTVGDAVRASARYMFIHSPGVELTFSETDWKRQPVAELRYELLESRQLPTRQAYDLALGVAHRIISMATPNNRYPLRSVKLPHGPLASPARYQQFFGVPVTFEQPYAALVVDSHYFEQPIAGADSNIHQFIAHYLETNFPAAGQTMTARVRKTLVKALEVNRAELDSVAEMLIVHPRKLQRDLADEGTSFEQVRDGVRRETAARYLTTTRLPLSQVAAALGLSEQSALTRSCKAWFGVTPLKYRQQAVAIASVAH